MSLDLIDDQSTLVQVMACCRQATSHYLSQCWPRSLSTYGVTRPQWVDLVTMRFFCKPVSWEMLKTSVTQLYLKKWHLQLHPPRLREPSELNSGSSHYLYHGLHDAVIKWKHFLHYWPFLQGIHRSPVNSPHKGQWRGALMLSLICVWINSWENSGEAGDWRCYRAHYDVIVMNPGFDTEIGYLLIYVSLVTISVRSLIFMNVMIHTCHWNTLRPRQNGYNFLDNIFKWIALNENVWIAIRISLKYVPGSPVDKKWAITWTSQ